MTPAHGRVLRIVVVIVALVVVVGIGDSQRRLIDLTEGETLTLTDQTRDIVSSVDADVEITAFLSRQDPGRVDAVTLLDRYRRLNRRIDISVVDPADAPGEVGRLGVDPLVGGVVLVSGESTEVVPTATEGDLTGGLARLLREGETTVCATAGHGERSVSDGGPEGMSSAAELLERDGYRVVEIDLLADATVSGDCAVLLVAAPSGRFSERAERSIGAWVEDDGRLLLLTDPVVEAAPLPDLLAGFGLGVERGVVFEGDAANVVGGDVSAPIVDRYPSASPVVHGLPPTFFPVVQEVTVADETEVAGLSTGRLAETSATSYLEREPLAAEFDPDEDRSGPIAVVGAADRSRVDGVDVRRTRILVTGDADFASNIAVREAGNAQLVRQSMAWLTQTEDLVAISPNLPRDRPLRLTDQRADYALVLSVGVVPGLFLLAGAMVWAVRRGR